MPVKRFMLSDKINLPKDIAISKVKDKYLVVAPEKGTYIVLDSIQLQFFNYLKVGHTLGELLNSQHYNIKFYLELRDLLVQFEFRKFYESYQPNPREELSAHIYLTNACNLRCIHCYRYSGNKEREEFNINDWKEILLKLREHEIKEISLSGGEPFIFDGIYELIDYAVDIGMDVIALSNGTKIDFKQTPTLKKLKGIKLSIDGPTEKINDDIRGKGVYRKVMEALDKLYSLGVTVALSMVLFDKYFGEYKLSMEPFLQKLKDTYGHCVKMYFSTGILAGRNICKDELSLFYNYSLQNFIDGVCKKVYGHEWILQAYTDLFTLNFHTNCGYGNVITIGPTGKVYPCSLPYYPIGDIHKDSISNVILRLKNLNQKYGVDNLEPCSKCDIRYICSGACRVMNMYLYGSAHKIKCEKKSIQELRHVLVEGYPFLYTIKKKEGKDEQRE